jgi:hypothetical protein
MKIHIACTQGVNEDWGRMDIDRVEGSAAFLLATIEAHLVIRDGQLVVEIEARNTDNKPHVTFEFKTLENISQARAEIH